MDLTLLFGFLVLSALLSVIPGPSVILATGRAITQGSRAAVWIVFGNALGGLMLLALVIVGLGAVIAASAALFTVVKILGAIYLLWLGLRALWSARTWPYCRSSLIPPLARSRFRCCSSASPAVSSSW